MWCCNKCNEIAFVKCHTNAHGLPPAWREILETHQDSDQDHQPDLNIAQEFTKVRQLEVWVGNTSQVTAHMSQQLSLFVVGQPFRLHRCIRNHEECGNSDEDRQNTHEDEHDSPSGQCFSANLLKAIWNDSSEDLSDSQTAVPERESRRLFRTSCRRKTQLVNDFGRWKISIKHLLYHCEDNSIKQGAIAASKMPKKIRQTSMVVYEVAAAWQAVAIPHKTTLIPSHFATPTFCKMKPVFVSVVPTMKTST